MVQAESRGDLRLFPWFDAINVKMIQIPFLKFMCFCVVKLKLLRGMVDDNQIGILCNFSSTACFVVIVTWCSKFFVVWAIVDGFESEKSTHMFYASFCVGNVNVREWNN